MGEIHKLRVKSPYELMSIVDIKIKNKPNQHGYLYLKCLIDDSIKFQSTINASTEDKICIYEEQEYDRSTSCDQTLININVINESKSKIIFNGIVQNVNTSNVSGVYYIEIHALTSSFELDIKEKSRSFQNIHMTYDEVIGIILGDYSGYGFVQCVGEGQAIGKPLFQYKETDWNFLKRIASQLNSDLYCYIIEIRNMFYFGRQSKASYELEDMTSYKAYKNLKRFHEAGGDEVYHDTDYFYYEIERRDKFEVGDNIWFKNKQLYVNQYSAYSLKNELIYKYRLCREKGIWQTKLYNSLLGGASVDGKVLAVEGERIKIHLDIDENQNEEEAFWFRYAPPTTNIMYAMPNIGESARLYFPSEGNDEPIITGCVRKNGDSCEKASDPTNKYFQTEHGNEIEMTPGTLNMNGGCKEPLSISFDDNVGVTLKSHKNLSLNSDGEIIIKTPNNVKITSQSRILMTKGNTSNGVSIENEFHVLAGNVIKNGSDRTPFPAFNDEPQAAPPPEPPKQENPEINIGALVSGVMGAVAKIASCINKTIFGNSGVHRGIGAGAAIISVAAAAIAAVAKVNACSKDGKMSQDDAEEIVDMLCKALVGAFIARIGTGSSNSKNDEKVKEFFNSCASTPNVNPKFEDNTPPLEAYLINKEYFNLKTSILKGSAKAEARANIFEDGKLRPNLKLGAEEEMKMVEFSAETKRFGDKDFGIQLDGNVTGIKEKAELGAYLGENKDTGKFDCCVKGGAIATLSEATATQKFTILGCEISTEETGYLGAVGVQAEGGIVKSKFKLELKGSALIGGGFSISIGVAE